MLKWLKAFFGLDMKEGSVTSVTQAVFGEVETKKATVKKTPAKKTPAKKAELTKLTKAKLEEKGREFGIEIDKRKKKEELVKEVFNASKI